MILKAASAFSALNANRQSPLFSSPFFSFGSALKSFERRNGNGFVVMATKGSNNQPLTGVLTGVLFEPFEEVKKEPSLVRSAPQASLEAAINETIDVQYSVSHLYLALYAYCGRDIVDPEDDAEFFKQRSYTERDYAEMLMEYQNKRGGRVKLQPIVMPMSEFDHEEKGYVLYVMELALSLEKLGKEKLLNLHAVASKHNDHQLADFVESKPMLRKVEKIKQISEYVDELRKVGKGHEVKKEPSLDPYAPQLIRQKLALFFLDHFEKRRLDPFDPSAPLLTSQKLVDQCEAALNEQINVEYSVSYMYHALYAYFGRDNIALKGVAKFFRDYSLILRTDVELMMEYQNIRGGRVKLQSFAMPQSEFHHEEKGNALYAMELALSLGKRVEKKLLNLQAVASKHKDADLTEFVEEKFLSKKVDLVKKASKYVAQLRRVGKGHGDEDEDGELIPHGERQSSVNLEQQVKINSPSSVGKTNNKGESVSMPLRTTRANEAKNKHKDVLGPLESTSLEKVISEATRDKTSASAAPSNLKSISRRRQGMKPEGKETTVSFGSIDKANAKGKAVAMPWGSTSEPSEDNRSPTLLVTSSETHKRKESTIEVEPVNVPRSYTPVQKVNGKPSVNVVLHEAIPGRTMDKG